MRAKDFLMMVSEQKKKNIILKNRVENLNRRLKDKRELVGVLQKKVGKCS